MTFKEDNLEYAWSWFQYHAKQRYTSFYYYLLIMGALSWGYIQAISNCCIPVNIISGIGILGIIISFSFLMIEKRGNMLVNDGREALKIIENNTNYSISIKLVSIDKIKRDSFWWRKISHLFWFRTIIITFMMISLWVFLTSIESKYQCCNWLIIVLVFLVGVYFSIPYFEKYEQN